MPDPIIDAVFWTKIEGPGARDQRGDAEGQQHAENADRDRQDRGDHGPEGRQEEEQRDRRARRSAERMSS